MSKYYVVVTLTDNFMFRVEFDSFDAFDSYVQRIQEVFSRYTPKSDLFINLGNQELYMLPISLVKSINTYGYANGITK